MTYRDRLKTLSLHTLEGRRLTADLIFCYKIINGVVNLDPADFFVFHDSKTRNIRNTCSPAFSRLSATELFQCVIPYLNMLYSHLLLVCLEAIHVEWIWINSYYTIRILCLSFMCFICFLYVFWADVSSLRLSVLQNTCFAYIVYVVVC